MDLQPANPPSPKEKMASSADDKKVPPDGRPCAVCKSVHVACDRQRPCGRCKRLGKDAICLDPPAQRRGRRPVRSFADGGPGHWSYSHFKFDVPKILHHNGPSAVVHDPRLPSLASGLNGLQFASSVPLPTQPRAMPQFQYPAYGLYGGMPTQAPVGFSHLQNLFPGTSIAFAAPPVQAAPPQPAPNTAMANFDGNGNVIAATKEFAQLIGFSLEELLGLHMMNLHPPDLVDCYRNMVWKMVESAPPSETTVSRVVEVTWVTKQKERVTLTCQYRVFVKDRKMLSNSVTVLPSIRPSPVDHQFPVSGLPQYRTANVPSSHQPAQQSAAHSQATTQQQSPPQMYAEAGTPNAYFEVGGGVSLPLLAGGSKPSSFSQDSKGDSNNAVTSPPNANQGSHHASGPPNLDDPPQHTAQWTDPVTPDSE